MRKAVLYDDAMMGLSCSDVENDYDTDCKFAASQ